MCVQEEERLKHETLKSVNLVVCENEKEKGNKGKSVPKENYKRVQMKHYDTKGNCFFCKKKGHMKKDCTKYKKWLEKKGNLLSHVCYESNFVKVSDNTWWINSSSKIHITNTVQGFLSLRKPTGSE